MILDIARLLLFPALMAFAAASDLFTMTISNRVSLALIAGFLCLAVLGGMEPYDILSHLGAGVNIYVKGGIFVRPQVDVRYVRNFFQFGSNWVPAYSVAIGYAFGRR